MGVGSVQEVQASSDNKPLKWVLYSSQAVTSFDDDRQVIADYEKRPLIEEWHKAIKTGCRVEERQLKRKERWEPMITLMSIVAMRLVQMKTLAQTDPQRPAAVVVPEEYIEIWPRPGECAAAT